MREKKETIFAIARFPKPLQDDDSDTPIPPKAVSRTYTNKSCQKNPTKSKTHLDNFERIERSSNKKPNSGDPVRPPALAPHCILHSTLLVARPSVRFCSVVLCSSPARERGNRVQESNEIGKRERREIDYNQSDRERCVFSAVAGNGGPVIIIDGNIRSENGEGG